MAPNQLKLLTTKRFLPLFITQFLGAFNDNVYKNSLVILITYTYATYMMINSEILITIAAGVFILPFFLFSATAGQIADKYEKSKIIRYTKLAEILLALFATVAFYLQSIPLQLIILFLLGTQATFFGPLKYSILPDQLKTHELIGGNALLEAGTFLAILLGTILGGILASVSNGIIWISGTVTFIAILGYISSLSIPPTKIGATHLKFNPNFIAETWDILKYTAQNRIRLQAVLGISWFWLLGATYLSQLPTYTKDVLHAQSEVVTLFLTVFSVGIGVGSLACNSLLKGRIQATYVPIAGIGMTLFALDLFFASEQGVRAAGELQSISEFMSSFANVRILFDLFMIAACGGLYAVPLYTIVQYQSEESHRSRVIAGNNIFNAFFMVIAAVATSVMLYYHFTVSEIFLVAAILNLFVAIYTCKLLPAELIKSIFIWVFKVCYRVEVRGMENYEYAGKRVLIIANHTSWLDAALLAAFLPHKLTFAINTQVAQRWWLKIILKLVNTFPVDPTNPMAMKSIIEYLEHDHHVVVFPEGRITVTGSLMKIYEGPGLVADKAGAPVLPIRIDGAQYTPFSYLRGKVKIHWFPKITLTILKPKKFDLPSTLSPREKRKKISEQLYDIMSDTMFLSSDLNVTLFQALLNAKSLYGKNHIVLEDIDRTPLTYQRLIIASFIMGKRLSKTTQANEFVGIMLPNSSAMVVLFFALHAINRTPTLLNFTSGAHNVLLATETAKIKCVYTSRRFIEIAKLEAIIETLIQHNIRIIYLEDIGETITLGDKVFGGFCALFPNLYYRHTNKFKKNQTAEIAKNPAAILFTSGSEGTPKGVVLSHRNLQANRYQLAARIDFGANDIVFNALPMFHAFGLAAALLPVLFGMRVFMYPSPLHYKIIPELCYDTGATLLFGTNTFLMNYAKHAHPYSFYSLRYIFAGAEKIHEETQRVWSIKFGKRIFEGYGATEASPVLSMNTPMHYKMGTVGRLLPGIIGKLTPIPDLTIGERLSVAGPNLMSGYLLHKNPGVIEPLPEGWHDTGDIVTIDEEGYITIIGRAKRFAKIAGEMVSLTSIENEIHHLWPEYIHAVIAQADPNKGEQIILVTNHPDAALDEIRTYFKNQQIAEISLPRKIMIVEKMPLLGSGKVDYKAIEGLLK